MSQNKIVYATVGNEAYAVQKVSGSAIQLHGMPGPIPVNDRTLKLYTEGDILKMLSQRMEEAYEPTEVKAKLESLNVSLVSATLYTSNDETSFDTIREAVAAYDILSTDKQALSEVGLRYGGQVEPTLFLDEDELDELVEYFDFETDADGAAATISDESRKRWESCQAYRVIPSKGKSQGYLYLTEAVKAYFEFIEGYDEDTETIVLAHHLDNTTEEIPHADLAGLFNTYFADDTDEDEEDEEEAKELAEEAERMAEHEDYKLVADMSVSELRELIAEVVAESLITDDDDADEEDADEDA